MDWQVFWEGLVGDEADEKQDPFETGRLDRLSLDQIRELTKALSSDRKKLNQRLESLQKEMDLNSAKLDSLKLVGADSKETLERLNQLNDLGQNLSHELSRLNERLKLARKQEDLIRKGQA